MFSLLTAVAVMFGVTVAQAADKPKADPEAAFKKLDANGDGSVSEAELVGKKEGEMATKAKEMFAKLDKDKDGKLTLEEFKTRRKAK
jgi:Ca2+-binding EF-hand superfamily protein